MRRNRLRPGDDALSPVVGAVLLVGIAVVLMGVIGTFVLGFSFGAQPPEADVIFSQNTVGGSTVVNVTVVDGSDLFEEELSVQVDGQRACDNSDRPWSGSGALRSGDQANVTGYGGSCPGTDLIANQTVSVVWRPEGGGQSQLLGEYETI